MKQLQIVFFAFVAYAIYMLLYNQVMQFVGNDIDLLWALVLSPLMEEAIFRVAPMQLVKDTPKLVFPTIILSSALFGYLHYGAASWPIQGVFGVVLCYTYLKTNYWSVVLLHFMWNGSLTLLERLN